MRGSIMHVGMSYMAEGKDAKTAAKLATNIINNNFNYFDTFAVPKSEIIDNKKVDYDPYYIYAELDNYMRYGFPNEKDIMADDISKANLETHGYWITNKAGTGVILMGQTGFPVRRTNGDLIEFKFRDLMTKKPQENKGFWKLNFPEMP
jgi:hypothetical protein